MLSKLNKRRAVSPVIATVIIVAVTITVAVAVSYWMSGIAGQYTSFEKIEMPAHYSLWTDDITRPPTSGSDGWFEFIELKNSGSKDATITNIFLNNIPLKDYLDTVTPFDPLIVLYYDNGDQEANEPVDAIAIPLSKGEGVKLIICIPTGIPGCTPGTTIDMKIITAAGNQYPLLETLA